MPANPPQGIIEATPETLVMSATVSVRAATTRITSSINPTAPFTVLQGARQPAVTLASPPKVNFTVFSDGAVKTG